MSLLNDALKRASQSQQEHDTVRIHLPMRAPAPAPAPAPKPQAGLGWALPVLVILLIGTAGVFITLAHLARKTKPHIAMAVAVAPPPARAVPAAPKPALRPATRKTVAVSAPARALPPFKLQGINYYNAKWQAIINGKTVYVGDNVSGFRVAEISRNYVSFIAPDGSRKMLPFGE